MFDFDTNADDQTKDLGRVRTLADLGNNKIVAKCSDPYGFWSLHYDKGQLPKELTGQYTTIDQAKLAVEVYLKNKKV